MTLPTNPIALAGNTIEADVVKFTYDAMTNVASTTKPSISSGTGAPTFSAAQGSMYVRIDGGVNTRVYINTTGSTTWTPLTNAA